MKRTILKFIVRTRFAITSSSAAEKQTKAVLKEYLQLSQGMDETKGSEPVKVKKMLGVDEDMRGWSFFELLRHNSIVNQAVSKNINRLLLDEPDPTRNFDIKKAVMPEAGCGVEQIGLLKATVLDHLAMVESLGSLKGTQTSAHPIFGQLDAQGWNCLFAFHLKIHLQQAVAIRNAVLANS